MNKTYKTKIMKNKLLRISRYTIGLYGTVFALYLIISFVYDLEIYTIIALGIVILFILLAIWLWIEVLIGIEHEEHHN